MRSRKGDMDTIAATPTVTPREGKGHSNNSEAKSERKDRRRKPSRGGKKHEAAPSSRWRHNSSESDTAVRSTPNTTKAEARVDAASELVSKVVHWKRRNANEARHNSQNSNGPEQSRAVGETGTTSTVPRRAYREESTSTSRPKAIERQLYEPEADTMITIHEPIGRGRARDLGHRIEDSAGEPLWRRGSFAPRGRGAGGILGRGAGRGIGSAMIGRRRGASRGIYRGGLGRRFDSDDDENWYVRGQPEDEEEPPPPPQATTTSRMMDSFPGEAAYGRDIVSRTRRRLSHHMLGTEGIRDVGDFNSRTILGTTTATTTSGTVSMSRAPPSGRQLYDPEADRLTEVDPALIEGRSARLAAKRGVRSNTITSTMDTEREQLKALVSEIQRMEKTVSKCIGRGSESNDKSNTSDTNIPSLDWREKLDLCESLLSHYKTLVDQDPTLSSLANAQARMWKYGTYLLIDSLRRAIKHPSIIPTSTLSTGPKDILADTGASGPADTLRRLLNEHISVSEEFYNNLTATLYCTFMRDAKEETDPTATRPTMRTIVYPCVTALGDLARYRGMFGLASGGEVDTLRRYWMKKARAWYRLAVRLSPNHGKIFNHLAVLGSNDTLEAFYFYSRSLTAKKAFPDAREALLALIDANRSWYQSINIRDQDDSDILLLEQLAVRLYGIIYSNTDLELLEELLYLTTRRYFSALTTMHASRHPQTSFWLLFRTAVLGASSITMHYLENPDDTNTLTSSAMRLCFEWSIALWRLAQRPDTNPMIANGVLVYTLVLVQWLAGTLALDQQQAQSTKTSAKRKFTWIHTVIREAPASFWRHLAIYLTALGQQCVKEISSDALQQQVPLTAVDVLPEDFELQGFLWMSTLVPWSTLAKFDITYHRDAEDAVELIDADYGHWTEPMVGCPNLDAMSEPSSYAYDDEPSINAEALALRRKKRLLQISSLLCHYIEGWTVDTKTLTVSITSPLPQCTEEDEANIEAQLQSKYGTPACNDSSVDAQTSDVKPDHTSDELALDLDHTDDTDASEVEDERLAELKARKRELEALLQADRRERQGKHASNREPVVNTVGVPASNVNGRYRARDLTQVKTLLIDTNMFIRDLAMMQRVINSARWTIILPLAVVIELDGLQRNPPPLGSAARDAIHYLESLFASGNRPSHVRVQTARGNYLPDIQYRSEAFDTFEDQPWDDTEDFTANVPEPTNNTDTEPTERPILDKTPRKTLDDIILSICERHTANNCCLITGDANLRVKAYAHGVPVMNGRDVKHMLRAT